MSSPPQDDRESDESKKVDPLDPDVGLGEQDAEDGLLSDVYADSLDWNQCLMIERIADAFEKQWRAGKDPQVADFLEHIGDDLEGRLKATLSRILQQIAADKSPVKTPVREGTETEDTMAAAMDETSVHLQSSKDGAALGDGEREPTQPSLPRVGSYQLVAKLGQGGMGTVYKALHTNLEKIVAIKIISDQHLNDASVISRFQREMKAVGRLKHHNIVVAHDGGKVDGQHFLVMEYIDGDDVSLWGQQNQRLPVNIACEIVRQAAVGLQYAHENNLIHRDIKPGNLMISQDGIVKILDLGLALFDLSGTPVDLPRTHANTIVADGLTQSGLMIGTYGYVAPEQTVDSHGIDARADVYSLGATLYKLLSGQLPFSTQQHDTFSKMLVAITSQDPPSIARYNSDLPADLVRIVDRMISRAPEDRFQTAQDVAEALEAYSGDLAAFAHKELGGKPVSVMSPKNLDPGSRRARWRPVVAMAVAAIVLVLGAFVYRIQTDRGTIVLAPESSAASALESDRAAAEFVLENNGNVYVHVPNKDAPILVRSMEELPLTHFDVVCIEFPTEAAITPEDLRKIVNATPWLNTVLIPFHQHLLPGHLQSLHHRQHLDDLVLGSIEVSEITDADVGDLFSTFPNLVAFSAHGLTINGTCLQRVKDPETLTSIKIGSMFPIPLEGRRPQLTPEWIHSLRRFPHLDTLSLPGIRLSARHLDAIQELPALTNLYFLNSEGVASYIEQIAAIPNIKELGLNCADIGDAEVKALHDAKTLRLLELYLTSVSENAIGEFQRNVPNCQVFSDSHAYEPLAK